MNILKCTLLLALCSKMCGLFADMNLDDFKFRKNVAYLYNPKSRELTITLKNVQIAHTNGAGPLGKLVGSYPNPAYMPFETGFVLGKPSPHCLVYQIR